MTQSTATRRHLLPILIGIVASSFYFYDFLVRVMPAAMAHQLMVDFSMHAGKLGLLSSLFFYGYAIMQIPAGTLYDRYSPSRVLTIMLFVCALATAFFGLTTSYALAAFCRFIIGFTSAFAFIGALKIGVSWFPTRHFALYSGLVQVLGCIGAIVGSGPIAALTQATSWQTASFAIAGLGVLFGILNGTVLKDHPPHKVLPPNTPHSHEETKFRAVLSNRHQWWNALYGFSIWAPIAVFATLWGVPFLIRVYQYSPTVAASYLSFIWIGIAIGGPLLGWMTSHLGLRKPPMVLAAAIGLVSASLLNFFSFSNTMCAILLFFFGFAASAQALCFGYATDINKESSMGTAIGFTNMAVIFGGVIFQPLVGYILVQMWDGTIINNMHIYSAHAYRTALALVPGAFALALIISLFFLPETRCESQL